MPILEKPDLGKMNPEGPVSSTSGEKPKRAWNSFLKTARKTSNPSASDASLEYEKDHPRLEKWSMGVLNDKETEEVPGSVLLMSHSKRNEPLGLQLAPARISASSLPSPFPPGIEPHSGRPSLSRRRSSQEVEEKKRTADGKIILEPQPEESLNDPLNWPKWRRDIALISLGFYCMVGGGMTPVLAAGFQNVATTFKVSIPQVALTTGLYMMGLGLGSVIASPTAIIYGKRPVYLVGIILFIISAIWCAASPNYPSLVIARIFMGLAVSPCECLPSATIAEIFYLHERAYRLGIYTLLLLSGKNLVPLVSAAIIQGLDWEWVFWIIAMVVGFCFVLMFFFVPETFWDRTPRPHKHRKHTLASLSAIFHHPHERKSVTHMGVDGSADLRKTAIGNSGDAKRPTIAERRGQKDSQHVGFVDQTTPQGDSEGKGSDSLPYRFLPATHTLSDRVTPRGEGPQTPALHNYNSPSYNDYEQDGTGYIRNEHAISIRESTLTPASRINSPISMQSEQEPVTPTSARLPRYTTMLRTLPPKTYAETLRPWNGKLRNEKWHLVALRPFILFAYPAILWSTLVYSLSIGWLIVLSESVSTIYKSKDTYNFTALQAGLVYISPFVGGVIGTAVAGKVSDIIVRFMSRRNGGVYEPEFRLVMAIPVAISTTIGLMGFGWSAQERDNYIVPTVFFGIISFGCSLGSTTSITFAVDSYRQYAGEALVTLNFSKNIFHGLVFSLFFNRWLDADGSKTTFIAIGCIQMACLMTTIPMYIYGKRARMWTVRRNLMEKF